MDPVTPKTKTNLSPKRRRHQKLILQISLWVLASVASVIILLGVVVVVLLHNERFHNYVLNTARKQATEALGVRVQLQNYALNLSNLSLDVYGVTVDGANPYANPPLLQVDHAQVGVRVVSILHGKWYLDSVRVDRPIARVFVDEHGVSNIPTIKSSGNSGSSTSLFDLAIRRAVLDRGEIYYNNKQSVLAADLHDVELRASFDSTLQKYSGRLVYSDGHLISGSLKPISHNLEAEFDATPTTFHLTKAKLTSSGSQAVLAATLQNYNSPNVEAHYDLLVNGNEVNQILQNPSIPMGLVRATGTVVYRQSSVRSLFDSIQVQGDLTSAKLDVSTPSLRTQVTNLAAHYSLTNSDVTLKDFRVNLLGGQLTATGTMSKLGGDSKSTVKAALHGVSLSELKRLSGNSASMNSVSLSGVLNADAVASWGKTFDDLIAKTDASVHGQVMSANVKGTQTSGQTQATIPIESMIHGTYSGASKQISLAKSYVRTPQTNLTLDGVVSDRSTLNVRLQADDLHEIETIADVFRTAAPGQSLQPLGLAGTASFQGAVTGSTSSPHLSGQFLASDFQVHGTTWKLLRTNVDISPSLASLQHAELRPESGGSITFNASSGLTKWAFSNTSPVQVDLDVAQLDIADMAKLAGQQIPVTGKLNANLKLHGTEQSPVGNGSISLANLVAYNQPISSAKMMFSGTGDDVQGDLAIQLPAGKLLSKMMIKPRQKTYIATVSTDGIQLDKLQALKAQNIDATGTLAIKASGQGTFDNPQMYATVQIPQLVIQKQTITGIDLRMNVANHLANATLSSSAVNTNIQAKAQVQLTGDYLADATLDTQGIPLQPILAVYAPEQAANVTGQTEVHATLHGPLKDKNHLEGHVTIPILKVAYGNSIQLAAASPIHIDYKDGIVALQRSTIKGTDTDLEFQGSIPTIGNGPMSVMLKGTVNLQLAQLFDPDIRTSGELQFNINSNGPRDGSNFGGEIKIVEAAFAAADVPVGLQHGNGVLTLSNDRLNISSFQGTVGGGAVTAQGGVLLRPNIQFNLGLAAKDMRILYPQGMRESVNANLRLAGSPDSAVLGGTIALSDLSFTSGFDLNDFISQFSGGVASPPTPGFSQNLQLNLAVRSTNNVALVSRTLSIDGAANLQVRGTAARPVILGRVNLNNGDIILNGTRFLLNGGTVEFVNPNETQPVVNLALKTTIQQYDVYLRFNGPVDQLRTNYSSDPALPSADIINLLAFGKTTEASAVSGQSTSTTQAAQSLIASQVSSQVTSRISKIAGISQLSINPVLAGGTNQGQAGANITIQQRVTGNLFITYSTNVASTQSQTIQGQYQVSPRVAVSATRDQNGGFAVDTLIKKTW